MLGPLPGAVMKRSMCIYSECGRVAEYRTYCSVHARQLRSGEELTPLPPRRRTAKEVLYRDPAGRKVCYRCEEWQPEESFFRNPITNDKLDATCKSCRRVQRRRESYGVPQERYDAIFKSQSHMCPGCGRGDGEVLKWCIDHDHNCCPEATSSCGECIRGILCDLCNCALGFAKDDATRLRNLADYIESYNVF